MEIDCIQIDHPLTKMGVLLTMAHSAKEPKLACVIYAHLKNFAMEFNMRALQFTVFFGQHPVR